MRKALYLFFLLLAGSSFSQNTADSLNFRKDAPTLYLDCEMCTQQYYRQELNYINFVRDRRLADIYLLVTFNEAGGGGAVFNFFFQGQNKFAGQNDTLKYTMPANQAEADTRQGMAETMKKGLLKYIVQTRLIDKISYQVDTTEESMNASKVKDKWDFWTFNINTDFSANGNSYQKNLNMNYFLSAGRTGEKVKTSTGAWYNMNRQEYKIDDSTVVKGYQYNMGAFHLLTFSLGKHFGWGQFASYFQSSQANLRNSISYYPAIEYNIFPYEKATRKQLRFTYRCGFRYQDYIERTVYDKMNELYAQHALVVQYSQIEKWGSVNISAGGWHYFNYPNCYSASIYPSINFNPAKGLQIGIWGGFNIVKDQFYLRVSEVSAEQILLNQVKLKTDYGYNLGFNVNYTFGSIYNNIVNVRFELGDDYW